MKLDRLTDEERQGKDVLSPTSLITLFNSPKHFYSKHILKEVEPSRAMEDGLIIHKAVLEPDKFAEEYEVLLPKEDYLVTIKDIKEAIAAKGKTPVGGAKGVLIKQLLEIDPAAKVWDYENDKIRSSGKRPITAEMYEKCQRIIAEVKNHKWLSKAMNGGMIEQSAWWQHDSGVLISMRMDFYHPSMGTNKKPVIIDLKKSRSANPKYFSRQIYDNGLYIQAAMYVDGIKKITGEEPLYCWAVVEDAAPYCIETYAADFGTLEAGRAVYEKLIKKYLECKESNNWPGYTNGKVANISLPHWAIESLGDYAEEEEI